MQMRFTLTDHLLIGFVVTSLLSASPASGHSWYPGRCCSDKDCAPVTEIRQVPEGRIVTTKHGTVLVPVTFTASSSEDAEYHACMIPDEGGGMTLLCFFEPPGS